MYSDDSPLLRFLTVFSSLSFPPPLTAFDSPSKANEHARNFAKLRAEKNEVADFCLPFLGKSKFQIILSTIFPVFRSFHQRFFQRSNNDLCVIPAIFPDISRRLQ